MNDTEYTIDLSFTEQKTNAKRLGQTIRLPRPNELFLDIDSDEDMIYFERHAKDIDILESYVSTPSASGLPHRHVVVTLKRPVKTLTERLLLQAVLGSDRVRELISWKRLQAGNRNASVFFEKA